uniref:Hexosyltransferase n=1 Tax=Cyprinodon variegatus TaxID=28743 RepID=A0A3Q2DU33_CYPVA
MQWRRRHCCPIKMTWTIKRSLFRTHVAGLLSLALLFTLLLFLSHQEWLPGRSGPRDTPVTYTIRGLGSPEGDANQSSSLRSLWKETGYGASKPLLNLSSQQTWGNETVAGGVGFVRLFLLGTGKSLDAFLQSSIEEESRVYHDIIQQDYQDTYYNLTTKTLMGMNWVATYCPKVSYVMKTDSDMFVNTEYLVQKLLKPELPPKRRYFTGYLMRGFAPNRNKESKWYMPPEVYPSERYPIFCSGTGYVFSGDLAELIYQASLSIRRLHLEDVYVGICLAKLRIDPTPPPNEFLFNHWRVSYSSCKYSHLITSHQFHPKELMKIWNHLQSNKHNACINTAKEKNSRHRKFHGHRAP